MMIERYIKGIAFVLLILSTVLIVMAAPDAPAIISWSNDKTNDDSLSITVNRTETVRFNATANQTIDTWNWFLNDINQNNNLDNFSYQFNTAGSHTVKVNATNSNGTSNTVTWNVQVIAKTPAIISWSNDKTNDDSLSITVNRTETVRFNATANQTIDIWNWFLNDINQNNNLDNFSYQFNTAGSHTVKVNATNSNGTSNTVIWSVEVKDTTPPANITGLTNVSGYTWIKWSWVNPSDMDFSHVMVSLNNSFVTNVTTNYYNTSLNFTLGYKTTHNISLRPVDKSGNIGNWTNGSASTIAPRPRITRISPTESRFETIGIETKTFTIKVEDQTANVTWRIGFSEWPNKSIPAGTLVNFSYTPPSKGLYNVTVTASNENGTSDPIDWNWTVRPKTYQTGNRVWDASKEMSTTYTWTPQSFSGFFYDLDNNVGTENITIKNIQRSIREGDLEYTTSPQLISFDYSPWGRYQVIGFMAEKYFAGYVAGQTSKDITSNTISTLNSKQLHKVLFDDETKRILYAGSTLSLKDGYALRAKDVDVSARIILLALLKEGDEVDVQPVEAGKTYVYTKKVGGVSELPVLAVHFDSVFSGREVNAAFIKGVFQLSESYLTVNTGNRYGIMKITSVSASQILMENDASISLSEGSTIDLMGDIKIKVADNSSVLRFAPFVQKTGTYELRGTVATENDSSFTWTPMNFEGFYYDLDADVGNESLEINPSGRSVSQDKLKYSTTPQLVSFDYSKWGSYRVIGFMAEKYFAGFVKDVTHSDITSNTVSTLNSRQLHKVQLDDETKRVLYAGSTLSLKDGYALKAKDVDVSARIILLALLKDGSEVDLQPVEAGKTYVYTKKVGGVSELPVLAVHFDSVFSGREVNAAFIKGIFQISESYSTINTGASYGIMEVRSISDTGIIMGNDASFDLSSGGTIDVMGKIKFKVADSSEIRYYPYILVNASELAANQLVIDAPDKAAVKDNITIKVTAGGSPVEGASLTLGTTELNSTNSQGISNYTLTKSGTFNITATKLGYEKATKTIVVEEFATNRLVIDIPSKANQGEVLSIKVTANNTPIPGVNITFDNQEIGLTNSLGILNYTLTVTGTHTIGAYKVGYRTAAKDIDIRAPYSEFVGSDLNITPTRVAVNQPVLVKVNVTNIGTKADLHIVELRINETVADTMNVTLKPGEVIAVNFTYKPPKAGNFTVEVVGQTGKLEVYEEGLSLLLIGGIATLLGAVAVYLYTMRPETIEEIRRKMEGLGSTIGSKLTRHKPKTKKM